jgi:hypothetical protein
LSKPWWEGLRAVLDTHDAIKEGAEDRTDAFNAIMITNFSSHYFKSDDFDVVGERLLIKSSNPKDPIEDRVLVAVWEGVNRYGAFPSDPEMANPA